MPDETLDPVLGAYLRVALTFSEGLLRIWGAEAASARLICALIAFQKQSPSSLDGPAAHILQHLARIDYSSFDSLVYVTDVSHLVYATTLLDTFLSETTTFLFLLIPHSMGKNQQVPLRALIDAPSKNEAITQAALARAREIGYLPFAGRVQFLKDTFGLDIAIPLETTEALAHYSSIRNSAVHDQGIFQLHLDDRGRVVSKQKACPRHPTKMNAGDVYRAIRSYEHVARAIAGAVFTQVLKQSDHPAVQDYLKFSAAKLNRIAESE